MKLKINIFLFISVLNVFFYFSQNNNNCNMLKFNWGKLISQENIYEKSAILIPTQYIFKDSVLNVYMQLDLGSWENYVYTNILNIESFDDEFINGKTSKILLQNGSLAFKYAKYKIIKNDTALNNKYVTDREIIGTIGLNEVYSSGLFLDFKNCVFDYQGINNYILKMKTDLLFTQTDKIIFNIKHNNKIQSFIYDSGSSLFPLLFLKNSIDTTLIKNRKSYIFNSWGNSIKVDKIKYKIKTTNIFCDYDFDKKEVYQLNDYYFGKQNEDIMLQNNIVGIVGNQFFGDSKIFIEFKNHLFYFEK